MPKKRLTHLLESVKSLIEAHDGFLEIGEVSENRVTVYTGGQCTHCDEKCIEELIKEEVPGIEVDFL